MLTFGPASRLGNLLACQCGLRLGEVAGLRVEDIGEDRLYITHSWSEEDHLKGTKNNEVRSVPIRDDIKRSLLDYAKLNPFGCGPRSYVFWCVDDPSRPYRGQNISIGLNAAMESIGINKTEKAARNLCFHSWRHYFARTMADALGARTAKLTGHLTPEMFEHYANHANEKDFQKAIIATNQVFGRILPFQEKRAE
ncbi:MAG: site-specific integrase [Spirochaetales bacterium]|nr:site-specific integrase [Spirochaetales bacterium]